MEGFSLHVSVVLCVLFVFHVSEYLIHKKLHPGKTNLNNLLLSKEYLISYLLSFIVVWIQWYLAAPFLCSISGKTTIIGFSLIFVGLLIRIIAIFQLGRNYAHYIYLRKSSFNTLVTTGIYRIMRHPCYNGFILFQIGIQLYLQNIIGVVVFMVVLDIFFGKRVMYEERMLCRLFPDEYPQYQSTVCFSVL